MSHTKTVEIPGWIIMEDCPMCGSPVDECECEDAIEAYTNYIDAQKDIARNYGTEIGKSWEEFKQRNK